MMQTGTMTLTDFLLQRIAEDEAESRHRDTVTFGDQQRALAGIQGAFDPARVLAECDAKRRIVGLFTEGYWCDPGDARELTYDDGHPNSAYVAGHMIRALALPYADHPDYREEWKP